MAIVLSDSANGSYDGNLHTANGLYRVEAANMSMASTTDLSLSTTRTIAVTFANAGNCQGLIISLISTANIAPSTLKDVTVKLQENVASVWTDRATKTLTAAEITNSIAVSAVDMQQSTWIVPFDFATPYAVSTAGSTWRFEISNATGTNNWSIHTSNGTAPFYVTWCDNQVTFANNDTLIVKDAITVESAATVKGTLGTGDSVYAPCIIICKNTDPTPANVALLTWDSTPSASYTLTVDGQILTSAHGGFRIGTSAARIPYSEQAILKFITPTVGTSPSRLLGGESSNSAVDNKSSFFAYGEIPSIERATLNADTTQSSTTFTVSENVSSWQSGWRISIGKQTTRGTQDATAYVLDGAPSWNGSQSTITVTVALPAAAGSVRKSGGKVFLMDGYGVKIEAPTANRNVLRLYAPSNFTCSGVLFEESQIDIGQSASAPCDDAANTSQYLISHSVLYSATTNQAFIQGLTIPPKGLLVEYFNLHRWGLINPSGLGFQTSPNPAVASTTTVYDNIILNNLGNSSVNSRTNNNTTLSNCFFYNTGTNFFILTGYNLSVTDNYVWGCSTAGGAFSMASSASLTFSAFSGNTYENNNVAYSFTQSGTVINVTENNPTFISSASADINFGASALCQMTITSPTGVVNIDTTNLPLTVSGSHLRIVDDNDTTNADYGYLTYGLYQRTGTGLSDTTVRTSPGFALRMQPTNATNLLNYPNLVPERAVPTGNIQNQTMTVSAWIYINNTAYDAGTYTLPTLNVKYDNATTVTDVASATFGSWQILSVTFTPTTTYGQIDVWVSGATDATGSNAYFYVDDISINYPAGSTLNLGNLDLWANGVPVWPPIATVTPADSLWDSQTSAHQASGSFGEQATRTEVKVDDATALVLAK